MMGGRYKRMPSSPNSTTSDIWFLVQSKYRFFYTHDEHFRKTVDDARTQSTSRKALDVLLAGLTGEEVNE